jgi:hypothetical protein
MFPLWGKLAIPGGVLWVRWVGWADLGLLAAAVLMWATSRRRV